MSSSRNDNMRPPSSSTTTKKSKAKSSSSFGFKRGFLTTNSSPSPSPSPSSSSSSPPSSISRTTTVLSQLGLDTASTMPNTKSTASAVTAFAPPPQPPLVVKPQDPCPICYHALPLLQQQSRYKSCCGEVICMGCITGEYRVLVVGTDVKMPLKGSKEEEREFELMCYSEEPMLCPFCRAEDPDNDEELFNRLYKRINKFNDPKAMNLLGRWFMEGEEGLPQNLKKAEEFYKRSFDLGDIDAPHFLHHLYHKYNPDEVLMMMKYLEEGTRRGCGFCMADLAIRVLQSGNLQSSNTNSEVSIATNSISSSNMEEATRLLIMAARSGHDGAMTNLMRASRHKVLSLPKEDLASTLRAHKAANDEVNIEPIGYAMRYVEYLEKHEHYSGSKAS